MYQALYRKYRPQTFDDVVGQKHVTDTLKSQLVAGKMSHAYLFTGTRGTGKTSCAKILAKAVNCTDSHDGNPCNQCAACRAIDSGACVDVLEIDAASNNGVDQVRALRDEAIYSPSQVAKRVYIVDEVHMLSMSAFNALLKIIEEPPAHLLFILATTELHKVPATILSRCQRYSFRRLQASDIASRLNYVAYQEGIDLRPEAAEHLAVLADGALRDGLSLLDQCASAGSGSVTADTVCAVLGLAGQKKTAELMHAVADGDAARALSVFSELYAAGKDLAAMLSELSTLARDLLILRTAPKSGGSMLSGVSTPQEREALLNKLSAPQLLRIVTVLQQTASGFAVSANRHLDTEICLMELCSPSLTLDAQALSARIGRLEEQLAAGVFTAAPAAVPAPMAERSEKEIPEESAAPAPQRGEAPAEQTLPPDFWPEFVARVAPILPVQVRSFFAPNGPVTPRLKDGVLYLEAANEFVFNIVEQQDAAVFAEKAGLLLGSPVRVRVVRQGAASLRQGDPLEELLQFGRAHQDIVKINR